jgi:predicted extracellular nuclease
LRIWLSLGIALAVTPLTAIAPLGVPQVRAVTTGLYFSEYIEGSSNNKALEIFNGTGAAVDLGAAGYSVQMFFNGNASAGLTINLTGTVAFGDVFVLANSAANATILAEADQTNGSGWFNGDDAVVLRQGTTVVDAIGQSGFDPGSEWGTGLVSTADNTLRRKTTVCQGDPIASDGFDPSIEWDGFATDTFGGLGEYTGCDIDSVPRITSTSPANGASGVARDADIAVTFSEPVNVSASSFMISCAASGSHAAAISGGPTSFTLDPDTNFAASELCTVTVVAANVSDQDASDPPDTLAADRVFSFTTVDTAICGDPATLIHDIQGTGNTSPLNGTTNVAIEGVVVGDYQGPGQFSGFYVQEEDADADADPLSSEGIFVFNTSFPVAVGDAVRVRGNVIEFASGSSTLTELTSVASVLTCQSGTALPAPTPVALPVSAVSDLERYEGMRITLPQTMTATETFTLGRFGEVSLSVGGRLYQPTSVVDPGAPAMAQQDLNNRSRIVLDDGNNQQNIDPTIHPVGGLSASNTLRSGYTTTGVSGILDQRFSLYRIQPVGPVPFDADNPRPASPEDVGGALKVASMNVLNYFNGDGAGGGFPTARGAETPFELGRQEAKLVAALADIDADVVGLMEIENDASGATSAIAQLTAALNAEVGAGTYSYIDTGIIGTDAIRVALVYKPASVTPVGAYDTLTSADDPLFVDTLNRPALAQSFSENANGGRFTLVVNHLKSKGSACAGDPDTGDGQGNCNITRTNAATALANWLETDPTGSGDPDFLIIGDLNSYAKEDPIKALEADGYTNLAAVFQGPNAYSYVFDGQSGYLDHALANAPLVSQVTGVTEWHINADEPIALDYNTNFKSLNHVNSLFAPDAFRSSDHDPVIVGICQAPRLSVSVSPDTLWPPNHKYRAVVATPTASSDVVDVTLVSATSNEPDDGLGDGDTANDIVIVDDLTLKLRAERSGTGTGRIYTMTWQATNGCGATVTATTTVTVPKSTAG